MDLPWETWSAENAVQMEGERFLHAMDEAIDNLEGVNYEGRSFTFKKEETNQVIKVYFETLYYLEKDMAQFWYIVISQKNMKWIK
ncbi:hypothetical protein AB9M92_12065 [Peribacillus frigoritolerans]|uniref:hypothetical protein n=1 Tax=Peribacillus frigoritolerans TaxID=450367 RepID=UPI0035137E84